MSFERVMGTAMQLTAQMEALAVLAAKLRAVDEQLPLPPDVVPLVDATLATLGIDAASIVALAPAQRALLVGLTRSFFRQASELVEHPERPPGWAYDDPLVLQSQGRASASLAPAIHESAKRLDDLAARLARPGAAFLDVGTGVGWLAITLAQQFPALHVVGIDIWKPALALAADNIEPVRDRVTLREQDVTALDDVDAYDGAFLAGPFLPRAIIPAAIARIHTALRPGGWLFFGLYPTPPDPLAARLTELRIVRGGGHPWSVDAVTELLASAGYAQTHAVLRTWAAPVVFVVGRRT